MFTPQAALAREGEVGSGGLLDGHLDTALDDARRDGIAGETRRVVDVELPHEMVPMLLDRLDADAELRCNLLVGFAFGNQLEHLHLTRSQTRDFRLGTPLSIQRSPMPFVVAPGDGRAEKGVSLLDFPYRIGQTVGGGLLDQVSRRPQSHHAVDVGNHRYGRKG